VKDSVKPSLPTKKQRALLEFISEFIATYGYSPSYREIRAGMSYGSIATVAKHVDNLVLKGLLTKREHSARSLEPTAGGMTTPVQLRPQQSSGERWLLSKIDAQFALVEAKARHTPSELDQLTVLLAALKILGLDAAYTSYQAHLKDLAE
jgi:SOS-response transcriptional repressor LexA